MAKRSAQQKEKSKALYSMGTPASGGHLSFTRGLLKSRKPEPLAGHHQQDDDSPEGAADGRWEATSMARGTEQPGGWCWSAPEVCLGERALDIGQQESKFLFILSDRTISFSWKGRVGSREGMFWSRLRQIHGTRLSLCSRLWINWCQFVSDLQLRYIQYHLGPHGFPTASPVCSFCERSGCKGCSFVCS